MTTILALSPYSHKTLYPVFSRLVTELAQSGNDVSFACPNLGDDIKQRGVKHIKTMKLNFPKVHHITFVISSTIIFCKCLLSKKKPEIVIVLGPIAGVLLLLAFPFRKYMKTISYQPELHEDRLGPFFQLHKWISSQVDLFIDVDLTRLEIRKHDFGMTFKKTAILPNYILEFPEQNEIIAKKPGTIHFVYGGALSEEHQIEELLKVFKIHRNSNMFIHIYPITHTGQNERIKSMRIEFDEQSGIIWHSEKDRTSFLKEITNYDVGICSYPWRTILPDGSVIENLNSKFAAPTKVFDYLACGLYVMSGAHPTLLNLQEEGFAFLYEYGNSKSISSCIQSVQRTIDNDNTRQKRIELVRSKFAMTNYLRNIVTEITSEIWD